MDTGSRTQEVRLSKHKMIQCHPNQKMKANLKHTACSQSFLVYIKGHEMSQKEEGPSLNAGECSPLARIVIDKVSHSSGLRLYLDLCNC